MNCGYLAARPDHPVHVLNFATVAPPPTPDGLGAVLVTGGGRHGLQAFERPAGAAAMNLAARSKSIPQPHRLSQQKYR